MANVSSLDFSNATVAIGVPVVAVTGGSATTLGSTNAVVTVIQGVTRTKAALSTAASPTADFITGTNFSVNPLLINQGTVFVLALDTSGNIKAAQGKVEALDSAGNFINAPQFPEMPTESASYQGGTTGPVCPFAYIVVKNGSTGANWVFGTNNWNATGITTSVKDIFALPGRPVIS